MQLAYTQKEAQTEYGNRGYHWICASPLPPPFTALSNIGGDGGGGGSSIDGGNDDDGSNGSSAGGGGGGMNR